MKYYKKLNIWKASNVSFDPTTNEAYSYDWWKFVGVIKGKLVFNDYNYSNSTCKHQSKVRWLLRELGLKVDLTVSMRESLESFKHAALGPLYKELYQTEIAIARKGARQETKQQNLARIKELNKQIKDVRALGATFTRKQQVALKAALIETETRRLAELKADREARQAARKAFVEQNQFTEL